ncbi:MAG: hypothetical protein LBH57_04945, partial [Treponema sp.]|nr:hypothetical protein [Treponema sp.]
MKKKLFFVLSAILASALLLIGCPVEPDNEPEEPVDYGTNLVTEAAILAATGTGVTEVVKVSEGVYRVTGTVTHYANWDGSVVDSRIQLNISGDFTAADRYVITYDLPSDSEAKPKTSYTEGFRVYLENTTSWAGTWQHEYAEEYNAAGGAGTVAINRDLTQPEESVETGDYHQLVSVFLFNDADEGKTYTFTISNVGVYTHD